MLHHLVANALVRTIATVGVFAAVLLAGSSTATASTFVAVSETAYPPCVATTSELTLAKSAVQPGESNTAHARVSSSAGTPGGSVTFMVASRAPQTVTLVNGEASWAMPTDLKPGKTYRVTVMYKGGAQYCTSRGVAYVTVADGDVAGAEAEDDDVAGAEGEGDDVAGADAEGSDGSVNRGAAVAGEAGGLLPNVGVDGSTQIAALAGVALLAAGAFTLAVYRRRSHG